MKCKLTVSEVRAVGLIIALLTLSLTVGCKSTSSSASRTIAVEKNKTVQPKDAKVIRINAGATAPYTDPQGHLWLADQGFADGQTVDRGDIEITGTTIPAIYRTEHHSMSAFSQPVPNGAYTVKLHFAETFARITEKGQRVFSIKIEDKEIKDLDVLARSGGPRKALVETVPVTVTDGKLDITFTAGTQKPEINGIEIEPR
jgi:hypothetical protein